MRERARKYLREKEKESNTEKDSIWERKRKKEKVFEKEIGRKRKYLREKERESIWERKTVFKRERERRY